MRNLDPRRARWIKVRMGLLCGLMGVGLGLIVSSAFSVQLEDGDDWREMAEKQRQRRLHVVPKRGSVYDRNGTALAVSIEVPSVSMDAVELLRGADDRRALIIAKDAAMRVAKVLAVDATELERKILLRRRFTWVKRRINKEEVEGVRALADLKAPLPIRGLVIEGEGHRFYPNRELAGPLLGFVSPDGEGKDGIELELDEQLKGRVDQVRGLRDRSGRLLFSEGIQDEQALAGHNVYLTIDQGIQYTADQEIAAAVRTYEANWGAAIVVEPNTGEILALSNAPGYNPNDYGTSEVEMRRNRAISDRFEPGSTMKIFTMAAALAGKSLSPTQTIFCEEGTMAIENFVIHDTHVSGWLTPTQILALSSNIGAAKIGMGLGETGLYEGLRRFGFGEPTEIPMPGEASGVLRPRGRPWVQVETAAASYGYGIGVTVLQLAMGVAAIANGGRLLEPVLIKRVTDGTGAVVREGVPHVRREAMPAAVARTLAEMMVAVTEGQGTGVEAAIAGFRVAGKTATAYKHDPATGKYAVDRITSSFIGFVPAERPRIAVAIVLDEPTLVHAGGFVAAPAFRRIGEMSLRYLGVIPRGTPPVAISKVAGGPDPAAAMYESMRQAQAPDPPMKEIATTNAPAPKGTVRLPDLKGMSLREATKSALDLGLLPALDGTGTLSRQDPAAGAVLPKGSRVKLFFEPPT